jgi:hypothetical protein
MTASRTSDLGSGAAATEGIADVPGGSTPRTDHPGRWIGGAVGALVSLIAAGIASRVDLSPGVFGWTNYAIIALLGVPIGFILGRQLLPLARSGGWGRAFAVGFLLGWLAPPMGAVEILAGAGLLEGGDTSSSLGGLAALALLPIAIPFSFLAIVITIPVGLVWGVLVRLLPDEWLASVRVPSPFDRLGVRHVLVVAVAAVGVLAVLDRMGASGAGS